MTLNRYGVPFAKWVGLLLLVVVAFLGFTPLARADSQGAIILTLTSEDGQKAMFSLSALEAMGLRSLRTKTPWLDGATTFEGPLVRDVLKKAKVSGVTVRAVALNDYAVNIPAEDFQKYDVILALKMNGKHMRVRNKGPLWIVYPWDKHEELRTETIYSRSIWQLKELHLK